MSNLKRTDRPTTPEQGSLDDKTLSGQLGARFVVVPSVNAPVCRMNLTGTKCGHRRLEHFEAAGPRTESASSPQGPEIRLGGSQNLASGSAVFGKSTAIPVITLRPYRLDVRTRCPQFVSACPLHSWQRRPPRRPRQRCMLGQLAVRQERSCRPSH